MEHLKYGGKSPSSFTRSWLHDFSPIVGNSKDEISLVHFNSLSSPSSWKVVSVMTTNTSTMEKKMAEMEQRVILLTKALEDKDLQIATLMNKPEMQDLGESSHGPKFPFGFTSTKDDKRERKSRHSSTGTIYFGCFVISSTITRHDNKYHSSTIWRFFYKFSHIFKTLHKDHQQHENAKWVLTP